MYISGKYEFHGAVYLRNFEMTLKILVTGWHIYTFDNVVLEISM